MNPDEEALSVAKALYDIATAPQPGGKTQAVAKMQVALREVLDSHRMASYPSSPVAGYRPQSDAAIALVNEFKADEERLLRKLDKMMQSVIGRPMSNMSTAAVLSGDATVDAPYDPRWVAIARTHFQEGFMLLNRAVFQPGRVKLPEDE